MIRALLYIYDYDAYALKKPLHKRTHIINAVRTDEMAAESYTIPLSLSYRPL